MAKPSTDVIRRVFEEEGRYFLEVGPSSENPSFIQLRTTKGEYSAEYWGIVDLTLSREMALELGEALINAAADPTT